MVTYDPLLLPRFAVWSHKTVYCCIFSLHGHLVWYDMIYLLTAIELSPGGSSTVHIYTKTIHRTTEIRTSLEECGPCSVFSSFTLAFALQLRKNHGKTCQGKKNLSQSTVYILPKHPHITYTHTHTHTQNLHTHTHTHTHTRETYTYTQTLC